MTNYKLHRIWFTEFHYVPGSPRVLRGDRYRLQDDRTEDAVAAAVLMDSMESNTLIDLCRDLRDCLELTRARLS